MHAPSFLVYVLPPYGFTDNSSKVIEAGAKQKQLQVFRCRPLDKLALTVQPWDIWRLQVGRIDQTQLLVAQLIAALLPVLCQLLSHGQRHGRPAIGQLQH